MLISVRYYNLYSISNKFNFKFFKYQALSISRQLINFTQLAVTQLADAQLAGTQLANAQLVDHQLIDPESLRLVYLIN